MKKLLLSFILLFTAAHLAAGSRVNIYAHPWYYDSPRHTIPFEELVNHPEAADVTIFGLNGSGERDTDYPSFEPLLDLPNLESLSLCSREHPYTSHYLDQRVPQVSPEQWEIIKKCPLQRLSIYLDSLEQIPLDELEEISTLRSLFLYLPAGYVDMDRIMQQLDHLSNVSLSFYGRFPTVQAANIEALNHLQQIESLNFGLALQKSDRYGHIYAEPFGPEIIEELKYVSLPNLKRLSLHADGVKGLRVDLLAPNLRILDLSESDITGVTISALKSMPHLEEVYLGKSSYYYPYVQGSLTSGAVRNLAKIPTLRKLSLTAQPIKGADFSSFVNLPNLTDLDLSGTDITRADLQTLAPLVQLRRLKLDQMRSSTIRKQDIEALREVLCDCDIESNL